MRAAYSASNPAFKTTAVSLHLACLTSMHPLALCHAFMRPACCHYQQGRTATHAGSTLRAVGCWQVVCCCTGFVLPPCLLFGVVLIMPGMSPFAGDQAHQHFTLCFSLLQEHSAASVPPVLQWWCSLSSLARHPLAGTQPLQQQQLCCHLLQEHIAEVLFVASGLPEEDCQPWATQPVASALQAFFAHTAVGKPGEPKASCIHDTRSVTSSLLRASQRHCPTKLGKPDAPCNVA